MNSSTLHLSHAWREHSAPVYAVCKGRAEDTVFSASGDCFVVEWNIRTLRQEAFAVKLEQPAYSVLYIAKSQTLWVGNARGGIHVVDTAAKKEIKLFATHEFGVYDLIENPHTGHIYAAGGDGLLSIYTAQAEWVRSVPVCAGKLRQLLLHPTENKLYVACADGTVRCFETDFFNEIQTLQAHANGATALAFHPTKEVLFTGGKDAHLNIWKGDERLLSMPAHEFAIYSIQFSPDPKCPYFLTASRDKTMKLWDAQTLEPLQRIKAAHSINKAIWINPEIAVSAHDDRRVCVWAWQNNEK
jgi:WD40 repeat protein